MRPEISIYGLVDGLFKKMVAEFNNSPSIKADSTLFKLMGDERVNNMDSSFNMTKDLIMRGSEDNRELKIGLHDPHKSRDFPAITIGSVGDAWASTNTLGGGLTGATHLQGNALVEEVELRFKSQVVIKVMSHNQMEVDYLYNIVRNGIAGMLQVAALGGLENPSVSGRSMEQDARTESAPQPIYIKAVIIDFEESLVQKGLFSRAIVNDIILSSDITMLNPTT